MLALWPRSVQANSTCHCRTCLRFAYSIARRSTSFAYRRKPLASDLFTACYTTILGAAAIVDAGRKDRRRRDLDRKLEQARAELNTLSGQGNDTTQEEPGRDEALSRRNAQRQEAENSQLPALAIQAGHDELVLAENQRRQDTTEILGELKNMVGQVFSKRRPRVTWLQNQMQWIDIDAAIALEEEDPNLPIREPRTSLHMTRTIHTIESLVRELIYRSRSDMPDGRRPLSVPENPGDELLLQNVEAICQGSHFPSYESPMLDPMRAANARIYLNETMRRIFNAALSTKEAVGKICYNLLMSKVPPTTYNYNALISGFHRLDRPDLAQVVIDSYLTMIKWPATEQTVVCLLQHARSFGDLEQFRQTIRLMRGVEEDGLHLRIISRDAVNTEAREAWTRRFCASRKHAFVQRFRRTSPVYEALITGWLQFGNAGVAMMTLVACIRNRCSVSLETVHQLLAECLISLDQPTARKFFKFLAAHGPKFANMVQSMVQGINEDWSSARATEAREVADLFQAVFDLCEVAYVRFTRTPLTLAVDLRFFEAIDLLRTLRPQLLTDPAKWIMWAPNHPVAPLSGSPKYIGKGLVDIATTVMRFAALTKVQERIYAYTKVLIIKRDTGYDLDPMSKLPPIDRKKHRPLQEYPMVTEALKSIRLISDPMTLYNVKLQLLVGMPDQDLAALFWKSDVWQNLAIPTLILFYQPVGHQLRFEQGEDCSLGILFEAIGNAIKAILFACLLPEKQRRLCWYYRDRRFIPIEKLYEYWERKMSEMSRQRAEEEKDRDPMVRAAKIERDIKGLLYQELTIRRMRRPRYRGEWETLSIKEMVVTYHSMLASLRREWAEERKRRKAERLRAQTGHDVDSNRYIASSDLAKRQIQTVSLLPPAVTQEHIAGEDLGAP